MTYFEGPPSWLGTAPGIDWTNPIYSGPLSSIPLIEQLKSHQDTKSLYIQQDLTFLDKVTASVGLRNDWMDINQNDILNDTRSSGDISEFTSRFGLSYKFTEEFMAYASYAQSAVPSSVLTKAELGEQYEIGVKYRPDSFPALFSASIYDLTREDFAVTDPNTRVVTTIGKARVRGLDLEAKAEITNNLSLTASYSYLNSKILESGPQRTDGNELSFVPNHTASVWGNYTLEGNDTLGDMTFGLGARYIGSYYFDDANTQKTGNNVVFDASFNYKIQENTSLDLNVNNLFDKKYVAYGGFGADFYNPGRSFAVTLRRTW
jgi:iron complex outermembrane receptor protein